MRSRRAGLQIRLKCSRARSLADAAQQPPKDFNIDINVNRDGGRWYASPVWIAIGVLAAVVLVLLIAMALRGGGGTTVVRG